MIPPTEHLQQALQHVLQASAAFRSADPAARAHGEQVFLEVRNADNVLEYAVFFIEHSADAFTTYQSFNMILHVLPHLPLSAAPLSAHVPSFAALRDVLLQLTVQRSLLPASSAAGAASTSAGASSGSADWPTYVRARALQTVAAVGKKALAAELEAALPASTEGLADPHAAAAAEQHLQHAAAQCLEPTRSALRQLLSTGGADSAGAHAGRSVGAALLRALLEEFGAAHLEAEDDGEDAAARPQDKGKGRDDGSGAGAASSAALVGLTAAQHRLCKAAFQRCVYPEALDLVLHNVRVLSQEHGSGGAEADADGSELSACLAALEVLLGWDIMADGNEPVRLALGPSGADHAHSHQQHEQRAHLLQHLAEKLLAPDLLLLIAGAYRHTALRDAHHPTTVASIALHRARQCLLLAFALDHSLAATFGEGTLLQQQQQQQSQQHAHGQPHRRLETQLELLKMLIRETAHAPSARSSLVAHGNGLLFLAQLALKTFQSPLHSALALATSLVSGASNGGSVDQSRLLDLLNALAALTHAIFAFAFERSRQTQEEDDLQALGEEAADAALACWSALVASLRGQLAVAHDGEPGLPALLAMWSAVQAGLQSELVQAYIRGRLAAAKIGVEEHDDDLFSEQGDEAQKDRDLCSDQLIGLGLLARIGAAETLKLLGDELRPRLAQALAIGSGSGDVPEADQAVLWEQTHWLLLIAGHVIADGSSGETPAPPIELISVANAAGDEQLLAGFIGDIGIESFSRFAQLPSHAVSPQVMETFVWFTGRWAASYVLSSEGPFAGSGSHADAGNVALNSLTTTLARILQAWTAEMDVIKELAATLKALQLSETIPSSLMERQELGALLSAAIQVMPILPAGTHGDLLAALVGLLFAAQTATAQSSAENYFQQVTAYIRGRFEALVQSAGTNAQSAETIIEVQKLLDMLEGLARAIQPRSAHIIFSFEAQFFHALNQLCKTYTGRADIVLLVLRIYHGLASAFDLSFDLADEPTTSRQFYHALWQYFEILQADRDTLGLLGKGSMEADEPYEGLRRGLDLLPILAAHVSQQQASMPAAASSLSADRVDDLCLFAFASLMPLASDDALRTPSLAQSFSAACADVSRACAKRLAALASEGSSAGGLLRSLVEALGKTLRADSAEVVQNALAGAKALPAAATETAGNSTSPASALREALEQVLHQLLKTLLFEAVSTSLMDGFMLAVQTYFLALSKPALGGEDGLSATLHRFCTEVTAQGSDTARTGQEAVAAVQALFHAAQQHKPQPVLNGNGFMQTLGLADSPAGVRARARMQQQSDRAAAAAFCLAARPAVLKARAGIRVR